MNSKTKPDFRAPTTGVERSKKYLRELSKLRVDNEYVLYCGEQIVLPLEFRRMLYRELHEEMGHLGTERVFCLAKERFFGPV